MAKEGGSVRQSLKSQRVSERKREIDDKELLITLVEGYACIWDRRTLEHRDRNCVDNAWEDIANTMKWEKLQCRKSWKNLMDHFRTLYSDLALKQRCCDGAFDVQEAMHQIKWPFFKHLLFLKEVISFRFHPAGSIVLPSSPKDSGTSSDTPADTNESNNSETSLDHNRCVVSIIEGDDQLTANGSDCRSIKRDVTIRTKRSTTDCSVSQNANKRLMVDNSSSLSRDVNRELSRPVGTNCKFAAYLVDLLDEVPPHKRTSCHQHVLQVVHTYLSGAEPVIVVHSETVGSPVNDAYGSVEYNS